MSRKTISDKFHENFFKDDGVHSRSIGYVQGSIMVEAELLDTDELDESFFAHKIKTVVRERSKKIANSITVSHNKVYSNFNLCLSKYSSKNLRIQPDVQVKTSDGELLAVYEIKSIFGNGTNMADVMKDFARLAIFKKLFPKAKCLFVFPGLKSEMRLFLERNSFPFDNNITSNLKSPYKWKEFHIKQLRTILEDQYYDVITDLGIEYIKTRLSRTERTSRYCTLSWIVELQPIGYRPYSDYKLCTWDEISEEDFIYLGSTPPDILQKCIKVERIDIENSKVFCVSNDVEESDWIEFNLFDTVWKYDSK
jgi:hypothetical protein